jgi:protein O-mannosyl-transferase
MRSKVLMVVAITWLIIISVLYSTDLFCQKDNIVSKKEWALDHRLFSFARPLERYELSPGFKSEKYLGTSGLYNDAVRHFKIDMGRTYAIVVGISKYKKVNNLKYADKDAMIFADYLLSKEGLGVDSADVQIFINEDATLTNISSAFTTITDKEDLSENDKVIFYFAGHGDYDSKRQKDEALLLLYGAPKKDYFANWVGDYIQVSDLYEKFFKKLCYEKHCSVFFIADACHSAMGSTQLSGGTEGGKITQRVLEGIQGPTKILSCKSDQLSIESEQFGGGRGLFSFVLMEGLYGLADFDKDRSISIRELQRFLEDNVPLMAKPNLQDPVINTENPVKNFAQVNTDYLSKYLEDKSKNLFFSHNIDTRSKKESWLKKIFSNKTKEYKNCMTLIANNELDSAYQVFKKYIKKDSASLASVEIRRALSTALQQKAAAIILPMSEKINGYLPDRETSKIAYLDLLKASELLGPKHYLSSNLKARCLFLKALSTNISSMKTSPVEVINDLRESILLEPNAAYCYFLLGNIYQRKNDQDSAIY